jgi:POLQ-like helicase
VQDGNAIALYLGIKLVANGSVAVFCGRKDTAAGICKELVDLIERKLSLRLPVEYNNQLEQARICYLFEKNLGASAIAVKSAKLGLFSHHGNTPHGLRIAVEHAMREGHIHFVVCTSTLAQGVNLPIRYLIVTSVYQGSDKIKVRDFQNLMGRSGRAGMHTEGSVIFADPIVFDKRQSRTESWRWKQAKDLLEPNNSEPCISTLLSVFKPIESDNKQFYIVSKPLDIARAYISNDLDKFAESIISTHSEFTRESVMKQLAHKVSILEGIESFLLSESASLFHDANSSIELGKQTLAYHLANAEEKEQITELFTILIENILKKVDDIGKRKVFGKTMYGLADVLAIENWLATNSEALMLCESTNDILVEIWDIFNQYIDNSTFQKCSKPAALLPLASAWLRGEPFNNLFNQLSAEGVKIGLGKRPRILTLEHTIDLCENGFSYDGALFVGAVAELCTFRDKEKYKVLIQKLNILQKQIKYGVDSESAVIIYELGFVDRVIAQEIASLLDSPATRSVAIASIKRNIDEMRTALDKYPSYYQEICKRHAD